MHDSGDVSAMLLETGAIAPAFAMASSASRQLNDCGGRSYWPPAVTSPALIATTSRRLTRPRTGCSPSSSTLCERRDASRSCTQTAMVAATITRRRKLAMNAIALAPRRRNSTPRTLRRMCRLLMLAKATQAGPRRSKPTGRVELAAQHFHESRARRYWRFEPDRMGRANCRLQSSRQRLPGLAQIGGRVRRVLPSMVRVPFRTRILVTTSAIVA